MSAQSYTFRVGSVDCTVLLDGASVLGKDRIVRRYPDATEAEYRQAYADMGLSLDEADSSFNILVAKIGEETVLVDTGEGGRPKGGYLPASMRLKRHTEGSYLTVVCSAQELERYGRTWLLSKAS